MAEGGNDVIFQTAFDDLQGLIVVYRVVVNDERGQFTEPDLFALRVNGLSVRYRALAFPQ